MACQQVVLFITAILYSVFMFRVPFGETVVNSSEAVDGNQTLITISAKDQSGFVFL